MSRTPSAPSRPHFANISDEADAVLKTEEERDYVRELAQFNLMKARLEASQATGKVKEVLGKISEEESTLYAVLAKINHYSESSPEYAQLMRLTDKKSRLDIATVIAKQVWDKQARERMFRPFTPTVAESAAGLGLAGGLLGFFGLPVPAALGGAPL